MAHGAFEPGEGVGFIYGIEKICMWRKGGVKNWQSAHIGPGEEPICACAKARKDEKGGVHRVKTDVAWVNKVYICVNKHI